VTFSCSQQNQDTLTTWYHDEGFALVRINVFADTLVQKNEVSLRFQIFEGERVKIENVAFIGMTGGREAALRKQMTSKRHWILGGGAAKEENLPEDREKLEHWYRSHGYRHAGREHRDPPAGPIAWC
jgi:outer membrane protein assembly factor BamA